MNITELKTGMVIEHSEDGDFGIVFAEIGKVLFEYGYVPFFEMDNGTEELFDKFSAVYEVITATEIGDCFKINNLKCIWKRPEKVYKGFAEITKALLEGKKLRGGHWHPENYIHLKDDKIYLNDIEHTYLPLSCDGMVEYKE